MMVSQFADPNISHRSEETGVVTIRVNLEMIRILPLLKMIESGIEGFTERRTTNKHVSQNLRLEYGLSKQRSSFVLTDIVFTHQFQISLLTIWQQHMVQKRLLGGKRAYYLTIVHLYVAPQL